MASFEPERIEVRMGTAADPAAMTTQLVAPTDLEADFSLKPSVPEFTVPETGLYYIGWHAISDANAFYLYVDNITLTDDANHEGNAVTPPYLQTFSESAALKDFTIVDANKDGYMWNIDQGEARVNGSDNIDAPEVYSEDWDLNALINYAEDFFAPRGLLTVEYLQNLSREELDEYLHKVAEENYKQREEAIGSELMRELENLVMLKVVDNHWMEHLDAMDMLREGVGLRAYGQKDPLVEYKFEAYDMFEAMNEAIQDDVVRYIYHVNVITQPQVDDRLEKASTNNPNVDGTDENQKLPAESGEEVGRNEPCPCGSGKKYKNCCGKGK